jgi:hypothetical protein
LQLVCTAWNLAELNLSLSAHLTSRYGPVLLVAENKEELWRQSFLAE